MNIVHKVQTKCKAKMMKNKKKMKQKKKQKVQLINVQSNYIVHKLSIITLTSLTEKMSN